MEAKEGRGRSRRLKRPGKKESKSQLSNVCREGTPHRVADSNSDLLSIRGSDNSICMISCVYLLIYTFPYRSFSI